MNKLEFIFIIIEGITILIEMCLQIYQLIDNKKSTNKIIGEIRKNGNCNNK